MDITYRTDSGILEIRPTGPLNEEAFQRVSEELKIARTADRDLNGILVHTKDFPGYERLSDLIAHGKFIQEHRDKIKKIALCTDSAVGKLLELIGENLTEAQAKKFSYAQKDEAEKWLLS